MGKMMFGVILRDMIKGLGCRKGVESEGEWLKRQLLR